MEMVNITRRFRKNIHIRDKTLRKIVVLLNTKLEIYYTILFMRYAPQSNSLFPSGKGKSKFLIDLYHCLKQHTVDFIKLRMKKCEMFP